MTEPHPGPLRSFGRRRGRRLRAGQAALLDGALDPVAIPPGGPLDARSLFAPPPDALHLEIGFGAGEHLAARAAERPEVGFLGAEPFVNGVVALLARIRDQGLANIRIWPDDARALLDRLPAASLARVYILHPDPWPKARHHKRRLIQAPFLAGLARVMAPCAELRIVTDHPDYAAWIAAVLAAAPDFSGGAVADFGVETPDTRYGRKAVAAVTRFRMVRQALA